jgi:hypothetical protein
MNLDDFLVKLKEIKDLYQWEFYGKSIRGILQNNITPSFYCPITAVAKNHYNFDGGICNTIKAGDTIDIDEILRKKIVCGADCDTIEGMVYSDLNDSEKEEALQIRRKMLEILNLKEPM